MVIVFSMSLFLVNFIARLRWYIRVWVQLSKNSFGSFFANPVNSIGYFLGKVVRFVFLYLFVSSLFRLTDSLSGVTKEQTIFFLLFFSVLDVLSQSCLRGAYFFVGQARKGLLDHMLIRPVNTIFYILSQRTDPLDLIFLVPLLGIAIYTGLQAGVVVTISQVALALLLSFCGLVIILSIHIIVIALSVYKNAGDSLLWVYRDCMRIATFPPNVFPLSVQLFFLYILPFMAIVAFPVYAWLGQIAVLDIVYFVLFSLLFFLFSIFVWRWSLREYSGVSS